MALCIAYLCISSFSASFCKRNIIKIIMKIRFCELSSLGAPVFWGFLWHLWYLLSSSPWAAGGDWILQRPWGWAWGDPSRAQGEGLTPNPPGGQEQDLLLPTQTLEQFQCFGTSSPSGGELAQHFLHTRSCSWAGLYWAGFYWAWILPLPRPHWPSKTAPPILSPVLCRIFNVCKKPQVFFSHKETKHPPLLVPPSFFWTPPKQQFSDCFENSIGNYLKG